MRITEKTLVDHIVRTNTDTLPIFWNYGMFYVGGPVRNYQTVAEICALFGVNKEEFLLDLKSA